MRASTSRNQANGSTPHCLQEAMKLRNIAAVLQHRRCRRGRGPTQYCGWRVWWHGCQSTTRRLPQNALARPIDSSDYRTAAPRTPLDQSKSHGAFLLKPFISAKTGEHEPTIAEVASHLF
jgi:hypothetical protein